MDVVMPLIEVEEVEEIMIQTTTEKELFHASLAIGSVVEMNNRATTEIVARIDATGKSPYDLTVRELLAIIDAT